MIETGNTDELAFLLIASLVVLGFVTHLYGPGLASVDRLAMVGAIGESPAGIEQATSTRKALPIPVCPFVASRDFQVFEFDGTALVGIAGPFELAQKATVLPGTYTVRAFTYDQAYGREQKTNQAFEQWYLDIYQTGTKVAELGPTRDLTDGLVLTRSFDTFTNALALPNGADEIIVRHAHPTRKDNSVVPKCVVFERASII